MNLRQLSHWVLNLLKWRQSDNHHRGMDIQILHRRISNLEELILVSIQARGRDNEDEILSGIEKRLQADTIGTDAKKLFDNEVSKNDQVDAMIADFERAIKEADG